MHTSMSVGEGEYLSIYLPTYLPAWKKISVIISLKNVMDSGQKIRIVFFFRSVASHDEWIYEFAAMDSRNQWQNEKSDYISVSEWVTAIFPIHIITKTVDEQPFRFVILF